MKIQRVIIVFTFTFAVTLGLVVGQRLSTEAVAVIVGVVAGVVAAIPSSLVVVWIARNALTAPARGGAAPEPRPEPPERETRIIVVPASAPAPIYPTGNACLAPSMPMSGYMPAAQPRQFTIIGGEATPEESLMRWR